MVIKKKYIDSFRPDLKMENILLSGFDPTLKTSEGQGPETSNLVTKLGDLGIVMPPTKGIVQPLTYRAPEIYFKHSITPAADIWSWGLLVCHLLEARSSTPTPGSISPQALSHRRTTNLAPPPSLQSLSSTDSAATSSSNPQTPTSTNFTDRGLYDDLYTGHGLRSQQEQSIRNALANDCDLCSIPYYADCALPVRDREHMAGRQWTRLREKGIQEEDVAFLKWVMDPDPTTRPTAKMVLESSWLGFEKEATGSVGGVKGDVEVVQGRCQKRKPSTYLEYGFGAVKKPVVMRNS
jgi:serine/threonine protein kinase